MIFIDTLSDFIKERIDKNDFGVFYPQNANYMCTFEIMKNARESQGKKVISTRAFNWLIKILSFFVPLVNKVYGNKTYDLLDTTNKKITTIGLFYSMAPTN